MLIKDNGNVIKVYVMLWFFLLAKKVIKESDNVETKLTVKIDELNNLLQHSLKLSLLKLLLNKKEITEKEFFILRKVIKKQHFRLKS